MLAKALQRVNCRSKLVIPLPERGPDAQSLGEAAILPQAGASTLAERERQAIADTLQDTSGKLAETARRLGISRTTLWRRLKSYGMDGFRASP